MSNRGAFKGRPISGFKGRPITMLFEVKAIINNLSLTYVPRIISNHLFQHQIKYKLLKNTFNDNTLVYDEKVPRHFWRIAIVTEVLANGNFEIRGAIVRIAKTITILKRPLNKLFPV